MLALRMGFVPPQYSFSGVPIWFTSAIAMFGVMFLLGISRQNSIIVLATAFSWLIAVYFTNWVLIFLFFWSTTISTLSELFFLLISFFANFAKAGAEKKPVQMHVSTLVMGPEKKVARPRRFEHLTYRFVVCRSIQLS